MDVTLRSSIRKSIAVTLVIAAVGVGYVAHGTTGSRRSPVGHAAVSTKLTAAQLLAAASAATAGIYLQYDGVTGPPGAKHTQHMPLTSFQFGTARGASISGGTRIIGKPSVSEITVTHTSDKYSVPMLNESLRGEGTGNAVIYLSNVNSGGKLIDLLEFDLGHAAVTSYSTSSGGSVPSESFSLNFLTITVTARFVSPAQTVSYNLLSQS